MHRKACGSFVLMVAGELPGDPEVEEPYSLAGVFDWYQDCPEQIRRALYPLVAIAIKAEDCLAEFQRQSSPGRPLALL
jgi:hypothetical protein